MKMNKYFCIVLSAIFMMGLGMGVASCSDDDTNNSENPGDGEKTEAELEQQELGWVLITQLTDERKAPEGWENMTFEPTIGSAVEGDPYTNPFRRAGRRSPGIQRSHDQLYLYHRGHWFAELSAWL